MIIGNCTASRKVDFGRARGSTEMEDYHIRRRAAVYRTASEAEVLSDKCEVTRASWRYVVFSDENTLFLGASDSRVLVRRRAQMSPLDVTQGQEQGASTQHLNRRLILETYQRPVGL
ncbi:hypothetical protein TNCV_4213551 [Trichonephila clavipes]|nr:hypothetical protein TNCV_4213551 [Trichonephila clavipes]